jgi:glutamate N-acetyltransferase / amino-acid N-acetyltransferase
MAKLKLQVPGFYFATAASGVKKNDELDLALIYSKPAAVSAGVFTSNLFAAAPVVISKKRVKAKRLISSVLINSGNANAATGPDGLEDAKLTADALAAATKTPKSSILLASTGVIGERLPVKKITKQIPNLIEDLGAKSLRQAAKAIITTDTKIKVAETSFKIADREINVVGFAKGSGMINPNMATMLCFILTDAAVEKKFLDQAIRDANAVSFDRITVDGETSTNDTLLILANGVAGNKPLREENAAGKLFISAVSEVCLDLAKAVVRDGEGASKMVTITVNGARNDKDAKIAAEAIANSPLVKTAIHGRQANWGRIVSVLGSCGVKFFPGNVDIYIGEAVIAFAGRATDKANAKRARKEMRKREYDIRVELNSGEGSATVYTCDFSAEYIKINADYLN